MGNQLTHNLPMAPVTILVNLILPNFWSFGQMATTNETMDFQISEDSCFQVKWIRIFCPLGRFFFQTESTLCGVVMFPLEFPHTCTWCATPCKSSLHGSFLVLFYKRTPCEVTGVVLRGLKRQVGLAGAGVLRVWAMCPYNSVIPLAISQTEAHWHHFYFMCSASVHNRFMALFINCHLVNDGQNHLLPHSPTLPSF